MKSLQHIIFPFLMLLSTTILGQNNPTPSENPESPSNCLFQISAYVNAIHQDAGGTYWFGTHGHGVGRFNPAEPEKGMRYFAVEEGLGGVNVTDILEDQKGNIWLATSGGLTRYSGKGEFGTFVNLTMKDGLHSNDIRCLAMDSKGTLWIGTQKGVQRYDGRYFTHIELPPAKLDYARGISSPKVVHDIIEDQKGRIWLGTNGGAYIYDGVSLTVLSEKDGLSSNAVKCLLADSKGNIWLGTHDGGVNRFDGEKLTREQVQGKEIWALYEDQAGDIWFSAVGEGLYRFDGTAFTQFHKEEGLDSHALHCITEDQTGRLWAGGWKGVFRKEGTSFSQVMQNGPWE